MASFPTSINAAYALRPQEMRLPANLDVATDAPVM